jgi:cell division protein ZapE
LISGKEELLGQYQRELDKRGLVPDPAQREIVDRFAQLLQCLEVTPRPGYLRRWLAARNPERFAVRTCRGIYLWGGVGRGKTWLMDLFHLQLPRTSKRMHFHHFMRSVHAKLRRRDHRERPLELVAAQMARETRVLCLDEFYVLDIADAMILYALIEALLRRGVTLVITSNTPPQHLYEGGLQRDRFVPAIALLRELLDVVEIAPGIDYRLRQLEAASTYLVTDPTADVKLDELFSRLAGDSESTKATFIKIEGRRIATRRQASGMVWFCFDDICEGPRGTGDYLALAEEMHTVFISGVPILNEQRDDAARRFITLIDEFYDQSVKLVLSAAAEPQALYRGERLRGAFARTASRLIEMRSRSYLGRAHQTAATVRDSQ